MKKITYVIAERLLKYMGDRELTQYKLAQLSGVPFTTLKSIMQRKTKDIKLKTIIMLCAGLGITPSEFLDDEAFLPSNLELE